MPGDWMFHDRVDKNKVCPECGKSDGTIIADDDKIERHKCRNCSHEWEHSSMNGLAKKIAVRTPLSILGHGLFDIFIGPFLK
jgi:ribosomal protein S27AE